MTTATPPNNNNRKPRRKLPKRSVVDADLVSAKTSDARLMDDLLLPSEHDRTILSEIFNGDTKEPWQTSLLPRVVIGVPNKKKQALLRTSNSNLSYKERLNTAAAHQDFLDLSKHVIIPTKIVAKVPTLQKETVQKEIQEEAHVDTVNTENILKEAITTTAPIPMEPRDTQYQQECYVEIRSYAEECRDTSHNSDSEDMSTTTTTPVAEEEGDVKEVEVERIQSPPVEITPLSQAIKTPSSIQDNHGEEEEGWLHLEDTKSEEGKEDDVFEKIFNLMAVKIPPPPVAVPMETINKHLKLKRLKASNALDWIENVHITNTSLHRLDKKSRQIATKRKERLALKRQRPYVIRKKIKSIVWTE